MSTDAVDPSWTSLGRTDNATFYAAGPKIIVVVPDEGCTDDEQSARGSIRFQRDHWKQTKGSGVGIVLMDRVAHQTKDARRVYQSSDDMEGINGFALVTKSTFGRAIASVFLGLSRPPVPTRMFADVDTALQWAQSTNAEADAG